MFLVFPVIAGFVNGVVTVILQVCSESISSTQNSFWFSLGLTCLTGLLLSGMPQGAGFGFREFICVPFLGFLMMVSQQTFSLACAYEKNAAVVSPLISSSILFTLLLDVLIYGRRLSGLEMLGAGMVFLAVTFISISRQKQAQRKDPSSQLAGTGAVSQESMR